MNLFTIYPNPATNRLNVDLDQFIGQAVSLKIRNIWGQTLNLKEINEVIDPVEICDISNYTSGVYSIKLQTGNQNSKVQLFQVVRN